jgi:alpha-beta hydrolase superfamily lysophospholipase
MPGAIPGKAAQTATVSARRRRVGMIALFAGLAVLALFLSFDAQDWFYYPARGQSLRTPKDAGLPYEDVYFESRDGARLHGWFIPATGKTRGVVLHVHGNSGRLEHNLEPVLWLPREGYAVLTFDYRGYGLSEDKKPTPRALMEDTQAAIAYLQGRKETDSRKILILSQSLGGNNAVAAIAQGKIDGIAGMVLDATFYSYKTIADDKFPGAGRLLHDQYSASRFVGQLSPIPLFFLHGDADEVIPWQHSQRLFEAAKPPRQIHIVPRARHLRALEARDVREEVLRFFAESLERT